MNVWRVMAFVTAFVLLFAIITVSGNLIGDDYYDRTGQQVAGNQLHDQRKIYLNNLRTMLASRARDMQNLIEAMRSEYPGLSLVKRSSICLPGACDYRKVPEEMENAEILSPNGNNPGRRKRSIGNNPCGLLEKLSNNCNA